MQPTTSNLSRISVNPIWSWRVALGVCFILLLSLLQGLQFWLPSLELLPNYESAIDYNFPFYKVLHAFKLTVSLNTTRIVFYTIQCLMLTGFLILFFIMQNRFFLVAITLVFTGGISNFLTRMLYNHTVNDYFNIPFKIISKFHFNLDDVFVLLGVLLFFSYLPFWIFRKTK